MFISLNKNINSKSANNLRIVEHFNEIFNKNKLFHSYIRNHKEIIHDSEKDYQINKLQEIQNRSIRKENHLNDNLIKIHYLLKMNDKNDLLYKIFYLEKSRLLDQANLNQMIMGAIIYQ